MAMNNPESYNAISLETCEIALYPPWKGEMLIMDAGTLLKVVVLAGGGGSAQNTPPNVIFKMYDDMCALKPDMYSCPKEKIKKILGEAFEILRAVQDKDARSGVYLYIEKFLTMKVGIQATIKMKLENGTQAVKCFVQFIDKVPEMGDGIFYGLCMVVSTYI